jgi:hypothetical protein
VPLLPLPVKLRSNFLLAARPNIQATGSIRHAVCVCVCVREWTMEEGRGERERRWKGRKEGRKEEMKAPWCRTKAAAAVQQQLKLHQAAAAATSSLPTNVGAAGETSLHGRPTLHSWATENERMFPEKKGRSLHRKCVGRIYYPSLFSERTFILPHASTCAFVDQANFSIVSLSKQRGSLTVS